MALVSQLFGFTGDWVRFKVPNNVKVVYISAVGGSSGTVTAGAVVGSYRVKDTDVLWIAAGRGAFAASGHNGGGPCFPNGGAGGDGGSGSRPGGDGGGGASIVRLNGQNGDLVCVAAGAGGTSGDGSVGGHGGRNGANGTRFDGAGNVATGGGQAHGGNGGKIPSNDNFNGDNAPDGATGRAGRGGQAANNAATGGGGGGGGYRSGGGGQAGKAGAWTSGGGGGGSNYVDPLFDVTTNAAAGAVGHGAVQIAWFEGGDLPPSAPSSVKINGVDNAAELSTRSTAITISGVPDDPTKDQKVRILLRLAPVTNGSVDDPDSPFWAPNIEREGTWDDQAKRDFINLQLDSNTRYKGKLYSQDRRGQRSGSAVGIDFWTNRAPDAPTLTSPADGTEFDSTDTITFTWTEHDPDEEAGHSETPSAYAFRWRRAATAFVNATDWSTGFAPGNAVTVNNAAANYPPGETIEWSVAVADPKGVWSAWSTPRSFSVTAIALAPLPLEPHTRAVWTSDPETFTWQFRTQINGETQTTADIRYKLVTEDDSSWNLLTGDTITPGPVGAWVIPADTFPPTPEAYEWQVRTHTSSTTVSEFSESHYFWSIEAPGNGTDPIPLDWTRTKEVLGQGVNRVYLYSRGGKVQLGELTPLVDVQWSRKRDDMGQCLIHINQWSDDTIGLLRTIQSWKTELVVYRETPYGNERVFEGPVVRITDTAKGLEVEAKDVMAYVYRRLLRKGYNDSYQIVAGQQVGLHTVVYRAERIIANALAYDDPNLLVYLTALHNYGDAIQSRIVKAYSKTAWEEIDDMAANAGLDYSTAGRRIILNDTHRPVGRLPEMSNGHFSEPPVITEYGMSYATDFAVTNNNGLWGLATRGRDPASTVPNVILTGDAAETGFVEQLASQYGESDSSGVGQEELTPAQIAELQQVLAAQADRNITNRYPLPRVVRVPDNSTILPDCPIGINQMVPGVWIPLRAKGLILEASQWQKLDALTVRQDSGGEKVSVILSPAPNGGADPDSEALPQDT